MRLSVAGAPESASGVASVLGGALPCAGAAAAAAGSGLWSSSLVVVVVVGGAALDVADAAAEARGWAVDGASGTRLVRGLELELGSST